MGFLFYTGANDANTLFYKGLEISLLDLERGNFKMEVTETKTAENDVTDKANIEEQSKGDNSNSTAQNVSEDEGKTYSTDEVNSLLEAKKQEWQQEQSTNREEYLKSLPEIERLKVQGLSKDEEIKTLKTEILKRDMKDEIITKLDQSGLSISLAQLVQYSDRKGTMESLDQIIKVVNEAVNDGVDARLRGSARPVKAPEQYSEQKDVFSREFDKAFKG